jgi:hypothetical protein
MAEYTFDKIQSRMLRKLVVKEVNRIRKMSDVLSQTEHAAWLAELRDIHTELCKNMGASNG